MARWVGLAFGNWDATLRQSVSFCIRKGKNAESGLSCKEASLCPTSSAAEQDLDDHFGSWGNARCTRCVVSGFSLNSMLFPCVGGLR